LRRKFPSAAGVVNLAKTNFYFYDSFLLIWVMTSSYFVVLGLEVGLDFSLAGGPKNPARDVEFH
jgi:hypothetical protein